MKKRKQMAMDNNLAVYLKEINRVPLMTRDEEEKTAHKAASGDQRARDKLVSANLRFVVNVAKKYQGLGLPLEDLISEGNTGLVNAVDRFDVKKGYHFISYAVWWIRQAILSAINEKSKMIRLPANRFAEASRYEVVSLDNLVSSDKEATLADCLQDDQYISPDQAAEYKMMEIDIDNALNTLKKDEAEILRYHFGLGRTPMSLKEIGMHYNLSKERIRQIEEKALSRLRNLKRNNKLKAYVA
ncbi:MAG: RNA polymerase sigma factor RpoD/SigA [Treponema sp.]|jgi:RNA polymerase primary sigma factor|nr:RNA polymerase sigma factor RpoD/SigA [Treponema sp.]